jgi:hypothetical protein
MGDLDDVELVALASKAARPLSQLIELERVVRGVDSVDRAVCCEHDRARREAEQMSRAQLEAFLAPTPAAAE